MPQSETPLSALLTAIGSCRVCVDMPLGKPLPHDPRPVLQFGPSAPILIAGQAPGTRVHQSGRPFTDPSGDRLRRWLGVGSAEFYDAAKFSIMPMGFCFPGLSPKGADLPPRRECAPRWRGRLMAELTSLKLVVALGLPAARWHLPDDPPATLSEAIGQWRRHLGRALPVIVLPHPSWRNNALLKANPWIEGDLVPTLQARVRAALSPKLEAGRPTD